MRFSIRDLLWLTVVVALAVAWGLDHRRQAAEIEQFNSVDDVNHEGVFDSVWPVPPSPSAPAPNPPKP